MLSPWELTSKWRRHKASDHASGSEGEQSAQSRGAARLVVLIDGRDSGHTFEDVADPILGPVVGGEVDHSHCSDACQRGKATCGVR